MAEGGGLRTPRGMRHGRERFAQPLEHLFEIAAQMEFGKQVFIHLRRVNIDVDDFGPGGELCAVAGHTVGKTCARGNEQVAFLRRAVGRISAVHPDHAQVERVVGREAAQPHHGGGNRDIHALRQLQQLRRRARGDDAAADIEQRLL